MNQKDQYVDNYKKVADSLKSFRKWRQTGPITTRQELKEATKRFLEEGGRITYLEPSHINCHLPDHKDYFL